MHKYLVSCAFLFLLTTTWNNKAFCQEFKQYQYEEMLEYYAQSFLMNEVYQINSNGYDSLYIDKLITEWDQHEGFAFTFIAYSFNDKIGMIISSSRTAYPTGLEYTIIHLPNDEVLKLRKIIIEISSSKQKENYAKRLNRLNERIIVESTFVNNERAIVIWIDGHNRHSITLGKWERAYKRYEKFVNP